MFTTSHLRRIKSTQHINRSQQWIVFLNILEENQPTSEEIIEETELRYIVSQICTWDFFGIPQANYLALSKDEKSRMFNECHKKLVLKYFGGKNIYFFVCWHYLEVV